MTAVVALVASLYPGRASAQVLVVPKQDLNFGQLTPGAPSIVPVTDITRRAQLTVQGRGRFDVTFQLPASLSSPGGHSIPVQFTANDAQVEIRHKVTTFNPAEGLNMHINPADGETAVYLGGRALPAVGQPAGTYTATIVVIIVATGN